MICPVIQSASGESRKVVRAAMLCRDGAQFGFVPPYEVERMTSRLESPCRGRADAAGTAID
jgi:hypothetical protein